MKKYQIAVSLSLVVWSGVCAAAVNYNNEIPDCTALGYDMTLSACQSQMKSLLGSAEYAKFHPLHCPYDYNQVRCWRSNCGGYNITSPDSKFTTEECLAGIENGKAVKYLRYSGCVGKDGVTYRYDNGDCIERCDLLKYPYDTPPGTLYGKIETCYDDKLHYGYSECNEGFGELKNGLYLPKNGRCDMIICDVNVYPYFEKPNESRGKLEMCAGGTNRYYRYEKASCEANGYVYKGGACRKKFEITASSFPEITYGDILAYNGTEIATVIHIPDEKDNRYLAFASSAVRYGSWGISGISENLTYEQAMQDLRGKCNTLRYYQASTDTKPFPIAVAVHEYYPAVCGKDNPYCGAGEWYVPGLGELPYLFIFKEKNVLYLLQKFAGTSLFVWSSSQYNSYTMYAYSYNGVSYPSFDTGWYGLTPYIEFGSKKTVCD